MVSADRFLYLPLVGLLGLIAPACEAAWRRRPAARLLVVGLLASFAFFSFRRSALWADEVRFWLHQYQRAGPTEIYVPTTELSAVFLRSGLYAPALALSRRGVATADASVSDARYNEALSLARLGRVEEARRLMDELAARSPARYAIDLALLDMQELAFDQAGQRLVQALGPRPVRSRDRLLLRRVAELQALHERISRDQAYASSERGLVARAELASEVRRIAEARALWAEVAEHSTRREVAREAVLRLMLDSDLALAERAFEQVRARFGPIPELETALVVRRGELSAAHAAARELGVGR
jgi:hypothetical protein